jgi:hypothetical protein
MRPSVKKLLLFGTTAPYADAMLALDFVGSRSAGTPYYMLNGVRYPTVTAVPGWTYTGGTPAGTGSYAPKADGSLQFFPSVTNIALQSQTFDNAQWTKMASTVAANAATAPDGTATADKIEDTATTNSHGVAAATYGSYGANTYTGSVYVKAAEYGFAFIWIDSGSGDGVTAQINLSSGAATVSRGAGGTWTSPSATSVNAGNGWWRLTITGTTTLTSVQLRVYQAPTAFTTGSYGTPGYAGVAGSGIYIWGAQLELGSTASTYIPTTTAAVTVAPPRITDAGYLAEEARTNSLTYSDQFENAVWNKVDAAVTANQSTAPDGASTADLITTTVAGNPRVYQQLGVSGNGSAYTGSVYIKAGTTTDANALLFINSGSPASVTMTASILSGPGSITSAGVISGLSTTQWTRIALTGTPSSATGNLAFYVRPRVSGSTIGDTIYVWGAQMELGSFATSPIPTTSVAVTRAADVGYINAFSAPTDGTILVTGSAASYSASGGPPILAALDSAGGNSIYAQGGNGNHWNGTALIGGTGTFALSPAVNSLALAYVGTASRALSVNGSAVTTSATTKGAINRIIVGGLINGTQTANAPIRRIVLYPRAMSNAELQAVTTAGAY